ncbi:M12 family metallopeptidase [Cystobacter fuscus]|uniref:M12 family metallopeptidase n=1 Tax=Cystobacter fuscus TaxID=43 RepID=UPI002B2A4E81|nr:peptidase [Cystobacter fuscus]
MFNRGMRHAAFLALGLLSSACGDQEAATEHERELENDAVYNSQYPQGQSFQVRLAGLKDPVTAVLKGDHAFVGDQVIGQVSGTQVLSVDKQVLLELDGEARVRAMGSGIVNANGQKWPGGVIPYEIDPAASAATRTAFEGAKADYHAKTSIRWVPRTNQADYVRIVTSDGCWSYVGKIGGRQDLSLGNGCGVNPARHELGHAVGLAHEQVRQDRDTWVTVNAGGSQNAIDWGSAGTPIGAYDFESMMHYRNYFVNGRWDYVPKNGFPPEWVGNDRVNTFTAGDLNAISAIYGGGTATGVCFYSDVDYKGASFCATSDNSWVGAEWNDRISSVKVSPGFEFTLFNDINFGGSGLGCGCDIPNLVTHNFNDLTSSFRIKRK